jgi:hypothetical protein
MLTAFLVSSEVAASTLTLTTSDATVVAAFGKPVQGWWSSDTPNVLNNTNYTTRTSYNVSPWVNFSYRSFFTFDMDNPALQNETLMGSKRESRDNPTR